MIKSYYHAIMFDFDGTIVNTMHEYAKIASEEIEVLYNIPSESAYQLYLETSGIPFFQQLELIFGSDSRNVECTENFEAKKSLYLDKVRLDDTVRQALHEIRSLGLSVAITSNNFQNLLDRFLKREPKLFDLVLGFGNGFSKGPSQFTRVIDSFGVDRRYMLFVGDSLSDVRKSLAFGIDFVAVSGTLKELSFKSLFPFVPVISEITELVKLLQNNSPIKAEVS